MLGAPAPKRCLDLGEQPELELGQAVADLFHGAGPEAKPLGHHRQAAPQLGFAFPDVVSHFAALERRHQRVGDPLPGQCLPPLQLVDLAA